MDRHSIVLRAARPTFEEGLACGRYLDEAAEGFFRFMLGRGATRVLAGAYTQPNHSYSFENVTYAERGEQIVGMALGFTAERHRGFSDRPLKEAEGYRALRVAAVKFLCAPLFRILTTIAERDYYLLAVAVDKEVRGQGFGAVLMDRVEDRARASGSNRLSLDVAAKNKGALRFYERRGMAIESQWPKRVPLPGLKIYRLVKPV